MIHVKKIWVLLFSTAWTVFETELFLDQNSNDSDNIEMVTVKMNLRAPSSASQFIIACMKTFPWVMRAISSWNVREETFSAVKFKQIMIMTKWLLMICAVVLKVCIFDVENITESN